MKKGILLLFILASVSAYCQPVIRNFSFESWVPKYGMEKPEFWSVDSFDLAVGAVKKSTKSTDGSTGLFLGSSSYNGEVTGSTVEISDTITEQMYGLGFDYIIQNNTNQWLNGLLIEIYFYDADENY